MRPSDTDVQGAPFRIYLCNRSGMETNPSRKTTRTIRLTIPTSVYARLAYLAAQESVSVSQFVHVALLGHIANGGMVPLDLVPGMLAADGIAETPPEIKLPGDDDDDDDAASHFNVEDLL
jgi:hypothetical protein